MSAQYRLEKTSDTLHLIRSGRKTVGRVVPHGAGGWLGIVGKDTVRTDTVRQAFEEIVSRALGFASAAALHKSNADVRAQDRARKAEGQAFAREYLSTDFAGQCDLIDKLFSKIA